MDMWNAPMVQSRQPLTYRLIESMGLGGQKWHGSSWQRGIAASRSSWLSTLMIDVPGNLVWDLPCVQQASYLEGGPLMWMLPLYLHFNQKSDYDMIYRLGECVPPCLLIYETTVVLSVEIMTQEWWIYFKVFIRAKGMAIICCRMLIWSWD